MLQRGVCLVLLDDIDEVPIADLPAIYHSIRAFSLKYQNNKIVATCRVASFERGLDGFEVCEIDDFNEEDKQIFVEQWFDGETAEADSVLLAIASSRHASEICRTPLLITMICIMYKYKRELYQLIERDCMNLVWMLCYSGGMYIDQLIDLPIYPLILV
jgi:predicted NACHT family NTPase